MNFFYALNLKTALFLRELLFMQKHSFCFWKDTIFYHLKRVEPPKSEQKIFSLFYTFSFYRVTQFREEMELLQSIRILMSNQWSLYICTLCIFIYLLLLWWILSRDIAFMISLVRESAISFWKKLLRLAKEIPAIIFFVPFGVFFCLYLHKKIDT